MSVGRLYLNLPSSDITWNRLPNNPSLLLISEDSEEEDGDDDQYEGDKCLHFFL